MRNVISAAVFFVACSIAVAQEHVTKTFSLGDLAYLEAAEPCGWICFDRSVTSERDGQRCYLQLEKPGSFKVAALSKKNVGEVTAYYTVTVTGTPQPTPPGPQPGPGPNPPQPQPTPPSDWQSQVEAMTRRLGTTDLTIAPQVAAAFRQTAARCGQDLFTGPEIRAALETQLATIPNFASWWSNWSTEVKAATAKWASEKYRDAAAYRERLEQAAKGIAAVVPLQQQTARPVTPNEGVRVELRANRHQIRGDRLFEYRCPMNGKRCSWIEVGTVLERGNGWVIVQ